MVHFPQEIVLVNVKVKPGPGEGRVGLIVSKTWQVPLGGLSLKASMCNIDTFSYKKRK